MKLILKIAVLTVFIAFAGSCQKEKLPTPGSCSSHKENTSNQRVSGSSDTANSGNVIITGDEGRGSGEIVGGGDDDRDGGRKAKPSHEK